MCFGKIGKLVLQLGWIGFSGFQHNVAGTVPQLSIADMTVFNQDDTVLKMSGAQIMNNYFAVVAKLDIIAVIHIKGWRDPKVCTVLAPKQVLNAFFFGQISRRDLVISAHQVLGKVPARQKLWVGTVVRQASKHFFPFCHRKNSF